jgi:hypothetical protein
MESGNLRAFVECYPAIKASGKAKAMTALNALGQAVTAATQP